MDKDTKDENLIWDIRQEVGMVFQNPDNQLVATVVEEDVAFGPENLGVQPAEIEKRVTEALHVVDMDRFRKSAPHLLSGGQKQRIAIAGIIAMRPRCIVLDEPTAMLDPVGRQEVISTITRLNKEEKITVIHITHFMNEAVNADRVIVMEKGKIVMQGTPREIFCRVEELKALGLDVPQVTELAFRLRNAGVDIPGDILTEDEMVKALWEYL
jgi:energy-coupling factor transport system ATP-binding protein